MADLVQVTGVSRYGFYNEFGDKHDLFLRCIDQYANTAIDMALSPMEQADASLAEIRGYFSQLIIATEGEQPAMGCLIGNTAMSTPVLDDALANRIAQHYTRMRAAFLNALQNAKAQGELSMNESTEALADYLVGVANGYLACLRSMSPEAVRHFIEIALQRLSVVQN
ncbi:MAG: hypothetical protein HC804_04500 [Anaerolineae bacterium]|nr:hypothetical protein [Anaerolineae bacterium]